MTRTTSLQGIDWASVLDETGPRYVQVVRFLERAIADGRLRPGDRLPPQRQLARALGIDLTTVTRAYAEARERHLLHARGALGTFVAAPRFDTTQVVDLGMNLPPPPDGIDLADLLRRGVDHVLTHADTHLLMSYHAGGGSAADRTAGALWLKPMLGTLDAERIVTCPGAQTALAGLILALTAPGETILTDALLYPGMITAATQLGRHLVAVASDDDGMLPDALAEAATREVARVVYLNPTLCNPTARTLPEARRIALAHVARKHALEVIEDDPYWALADDAPAPMARHIPERTYYVATLSKALTPGLRTAYVVSPDAVTRGAFLASLRAVSLMPTPMTTALATQWIHDGTAAAVLEGVRREAHERQRIASMALGRFDLPAEGIHLWMPLPPRWTARSLTTAARLDGLAVTPAEAFSLEGPTSEAIRVSLGGVKERVRLKQGLDRLARLLEHGETAEGSLIV